MSIVPELATTAVTSTVVVNTINFIVEGEAWPHHHHHFRLLIKLTCAT